MKLRQTTLDKVPVGGTFYGKGSKDRYTKTGRVTIRPEEGPGKGDMWIMKEDSTVLVEAPKTSATAAPVKERKPWHVCYLCEHGPDYGVLEACDSTQQERDRFKRELNEARLMVLRLVVSMSRDGWEEGESEGEVLSAASDKLANWGLDLTNDRAKCEELLGFKFW
jgi:hypothetical protein